MENVAGRLRSVLDRAEPHLAAMGEEASRAPRGAGKWSPREILGHLIDSASNNHQRIVRAQLEGRLEWPSYEQEGWVRVQDYRTAPWELLVPLWAAYGRLLAHLMERIPPERQGILLRIGSHEPMTLAAMCASYVEHMEKHLGQIEA